MKYSKELEDKVIKLYLTERLSCTKIGKLISIQRQTVSNILKRRDIKVINYQNKLQVRDNLFETISNEEDAYWLGFIYADGSINDRGRFELSLKSTDVEHLHKFAKYCGFTGKVTIGVAKCNDKIHWRCRMGFGNQALKKKFNNLGVIARKGSTLKFPKFITDPDLIRHFIRGYIDGDGGLGIYHYSRGTCIALYATGTKDMLTNILFHLPIKTKATLRTKNLESNCFHFNIGGRLKAQAAIDYLYQNSTIYLDRKFEKYNEICRFYQK